MTKMPAFDPLGNTRTSQVFFQILSGKKNPKAIADALGIQSPPVIQQLRRLQKIEVAKLGEKEGKLQHYEVDFEKFLLIFIELAVQKKTHPSNFHPADMRELESLKNSRYFKILIVNYLKNQGLTATVEDSAREFENCLLHSRMLDGKREFDDSEKQEFFDKIRKWRKMAQGKLTYAELSFQHALTSALSARTGEEFNLNGQEKR
jgi:hypothetical protein